MVDEVPFAADKNLEEKKSPGITSEQLREAYNKIIAVLKRFIDMREEYYSLIALWIIGTYAHKEFETYPYLFINAMKGSGKTRLLKLIAAMSYNGSLLLSLSEAVMFRTAAEGTMCIDECERIGTKEKATLRELLNAAYKKGLTVKRMRKKKVEGEEMQVVEEFKLFCPIAMANIYGMEDVLGDRCINITLEKSNNRRVTKLIELFDKDTLIISVKGILGIVYDAALCMNVAEKDIEEFFEKWNNYISLRYEHTQTDTHTLINTTVHNYTLIKREVEVFDLIDNANLEGRFLEQFFPIFMIAHRIDAALLPEAIAIAKELVEERKVVESVENKDILLIKYIASMTTEDYIRVSEIVSGFKAGLVEEEEDIKWINSTWVGKALSRLNFVKKRRRLSKGKEVILNLENARKRYEMFKPEQQDQELKPEADWEQTILEEVRTMREEVLDYLEGVSKISTGILFDELYNGDWSKHDEFSLIIDKMAKDGDIVFVSTTEIQRVR